MSILTREQNEEWIVGAFEGGSNYWYYIDGEACDKIREVVPSDGVLSFAERFAGAIFDHGLELTVRDIETKAILGTINAEKIGNACQKMLGTDDQWLIGDMLAERADAHVYDCIFQLCVMGEIMYA